MNVLALDIGNTNIGFGLFLNGQPDAMESHPGDNDAEIVDTLQTLWQKVPQVAMSKEGKRDAVIVACSVAPERAEHIKTLVRDTLCETIHFVGQDIPLPMHVWVDEPSQVGTDRVVAAAAAYAVAEHAVVVADFGTAVTIDLVDDQGVFQGGAILPGFDMASASLNEHTEQLPLVQVTRPEAPYGKSTEEAIKLGLYYAAIGALEKIVEHYAEEIGVWPQTIMTGSGARVIQADCRFVDNHVPHLVLMGVVLAYQKHIEEKAELE
jgi:type III pantothenate kinase